VTPGRREKEPTREFKIMEAKQRWTLKTRGGGDLPHQSTGVFINPRKKITAIEKMFVLKPEEGDERSRLDKKVFSGNG